MSGNSSFLYLFSTLLSRSSSICYRGQQEKMSDLGPKQHLEEMRFYLSSPRQWKKAGF